MSPIRIALTVRELSVIPTALTWRQPGAVAYLSSCQCVTPAAGQQYSSRKEKRAIYSGLAWINELRLHRAPPIALYCTRAPRTSPLPLSQSLHRIPPAPASPPSPSRSAGRPTHEVISICSVQAPPGGGGNWAASWAVSPDRTPHGSGPAPLAGAWGGQSVADLR